MDRLNFEQDEYQLLPKYIYLISNLSIYKISRKLHKLNGSTNEEKPGQDELPKPGRYY